MAELRVLLVDDEKELVSIIAERLEFRGIVATPVCSGAEAIECARQQQFDMALIDVKMPEMNGIETMRRIKEHQPLIKVILMTGHGESGDAEEHLANGAYACVPKPIQIDELIAKINETSDGAGQDGAVV